MTEKTKYAIALLMLTSYSFSVHADKSFNENRLANHQLDQHENKKAEYPGGEKARLKFIKDNIIYPDSLKDRGIAGQVRIRFLLDSLGNIRNPKVVRKVHPVLDQEAIRLVSTMPRWRPVYHDGKPINSMAVQYVNFGSRKAIEKASEERIAEFPGGIEALMDFIRRNTNYPKECQKERIEGTVRVKFTIDPQGNVKDPVVITAVHPLLDQEAVRVVLAMPKWKPAFQKGRYVNIQWTLPFNFHL